ncbi:uncharacterized protein LOC126273221 [Schistocerca gregaria]|uniref:uncharacterized protein LOC126273221 n=1 Tax=Schistocerca gregaria TaxID=7010 RepID=UPI00211E0FF6|nr:uncharacterized protein LOC126273221 [Schistocerca gregaria]
MEPKQPVTAQPAASPVLCLRNTCVNSRRTLWQTSRRPVRRDLAVGQKDRERPGQQTSLHTCSLSRLSWVAVSRSGPVAAQLPSNGALPAPTQDAPTVPSAATAAAADNGGRQRSRLQAARTLVR